MAPGATMEFRFDLSTAREGFRNEGADPMVLANGTFLNPGLTPGHRADPELRLRRGRRAHLRQRPQEIRARAAAAHARPRRQGAPQQSALTRDADFIAYRATVCTSADQLPVTSGYVERDWTENGRRCIAYEMDSPMAAIYPFVSARYAVRKDVWKGPDGDVAIEIDYHPGHEFNLDRMVAGVKDSLDYFTQALRPVPAQDRAHRRVPALLAQRRVRRVVPQHRAFQRGDRLHREGRRPRSQGHRLSVLRDRARGRAPVVGAPGGAGQRAGRRVHHGEPVRILGADGAEAEVRRREDAPVPEVRARPLPRGSRQRAEGRAAAAARRRRRATSTTRRARTRCTRCRTSIGEKAMDDALSTFVEPLAVQGTAVRDVARLDRRAAAGDAGGAPGLDRGLLRDTSRSSTAAR